MAVASERESNGGGLGKESPRIPKCLRVTEEEIRAVGQKLADEPLQIPGVWGVLTAISYNARQRNQGMNIQLSNNGHKLGRCVEDSRFQINSAQISASHCHIYKASASKFCVKDTSTHGTYLNWSKLTKGLPHRLCHGDILSFAVPPHNGNSYAYVYREVSGAMLLENDTATLKRQREEVTSECKRQKGIGIGSADGPVYLDDVRSLERSNSDLRQQLKSHVRTIENLRNRNCESLAYHENEVKELKETISSSFDKNIKELKHALNEKHKELDLLNTVKVELESSTKDLNERLSILKQSCADADEIILSRKATISELEKQLEEERKLRREEREKATQDLKFALEKVQAEAKEETKRQANIYQRQHKEQQEVISKLQEGEKESRLLVERLRSKLEDYRENLITSEKKARQLESQVQDEQLVSTNSKKRCEALESELRSLKDELENEKVAREEAWAKVSALELEIAAAIQDLSMQKQRFEGAREQLILRETQLRAFYSTTEEISALFAKQQEQLKAMQRTLEDEEHYENTFTNIDLNQRPRRIVNNTRNEDSNTGSREVPQECAADSSNTGSADEDANTTEKNGDGNNTQDLEFTSIDRVLIANVDGGVAVTDIERILETQSEAGDKCCNMVVGEVSQESAADSSNTGSADEDANTTEKNGDGNNTQDLEFTSIDRVLIANVDGGDAVTDIERILETQSEEGDKCCNMVVGEVPQECAADSSIIGSADEDTNTNEKNGDGNNTQDLEFTSIDRVLIANVDGGVAVTDIERILETQSKAGDKCCNMVVGEVPQECAADSSITGSADEDTNTNEKNGDGNNTQDLEFTSIDRVLIANVDGGVAVTDIERILETQSEAGDKCCNMVVGEVPQECAADSSITGSADEDTNTNEKNGDDNNTQDVKIVYSLRPI